MLNDIEEIRFTARSEDNLRGVHPDLVRVIRLALRYSLVPFSVSEGLRSMARQREMVRAGSSQTLRSRHLTGHAVDVVAMPAGVVSWEWDYYAQIAVAVRRAARECGINVEWGGEWKTLKDGPHFQLPFPGLPGMSGWLQKLMQGGLLLLLLAAICLGGYSSLLSHQLASARQQAAELQKSLAQQAGLIATLQTQDAQNRALMAAQQRQEQQLRQQHEAYQRKYREAIKNDPCAAQPLPGAVLELLRPATAAAGRAAVAP